MARDKKGIPQKGPSKSLHNASVRSSAKSFRPKTEIAFVICEGVSEKHYFDALKGRDNNLFSDFQVCPKYYSTTKIEKVDDQIQECKMQFGKIFWVFDMDRIVIQKNQKEEIIYKNLLSKYNDDPGIVFCESLPSFELWLLLHFVAKPNNSTNQKFIEKELQSKIKYKKGDINNDVVNTFKLIKIAYQRAKNITTSNYYTKIYKVFDGIKSLHSLVV